VATLVITLGLHAQRDGDGEAAARMAGSRPPAVPISSAQARPRRSSAGVTRKSKATCENVLKFSVESEAPSQ
jgi:hypothetical protein